MKQPIKTDRPTSAPVYVPPQVSTSLNVSGSSHDLTQGDDSLLETLQSLGVINDSVLETDSDRIKGSSSPDFVFNLGKKVLSKTKIKVLEKGLGFSPTPSFINEADLQRDFDDFARKMRCKCILGMKVKIYLLKFLHISLNLHGIPQKVHQLWNYF